MKRVIVLEGADSSGKTTLAKAIGGVYIHGTPFVGWVEDAHRAMLTAATRHAVAGSTVVIDRHWVSEYVYGPIFRGALGYDDPVAAEFDRVIRRLGVYVLCVPSDAAEHERRFQRERPEKRDIFDTMTVVAESYRRLATGYMHEPSGGFLGDYIRHGDFAVRDTLVYDLDRDGDNLSGFIWKIEKELAR